MEGETKPPEARREEVVGVSPHPTREAAGLRRDGGRDASEYALTTDGDDVSFSP